MNKKFERLAWLNGVVDNNIALLKIGVRFNKTKKEFLLILGDGAILETGQQFHQAIDNL